MNSNMYLPYAIAILGGGAVALWAGVSPVFLLFLLACPLMMFFMMRGGMHGGHEEHDSTKHGQQSSTSTRGSDLDGSQDRIDRP